MQGHHLILGELVDYISGEVLADTHDERHRQELARLLVERKGYRKTDITPRHALKVAAGEKCAVVKIDFVVTVAGRIGMIVRYGPGSLVTRQRPALAAARLIAPYQVSVVVVTNGRSADILDGPSGKTLASGLESIPTRQQLQAKVAGEEFQPIAEAQKAFEARIVYAFEIDDSCPCDDTICRL